MNKRIEELITQATVRKQYSGPFGLQQVSENFDKEKFAELIIKECADLFPDNLNSMRDYTGTACRWMIREHFGVEK
jgi:hypothetical protein